MKSLEGFIDVKPYIIEQLSATKLLVINYLSGMHPLCFFSDLVSNPGDQSINFDQL